MNFTPSLPGPCSVSRNPASSMNFAQGCLLEVVAGPPGAGSGAAFEAAGGVVEQAVSVRIAARNKKRRRWRMTYRIAGEIWDGGFPNPRREPFPACSCQEEAGLGTG